MAESPTAPPPDGTDAFGQWNTNQATEATEGDEDTTQAAAEAKMGFNSRADGVVDLTPESLHQVYQNRQVDVVAGNQWLAMTNLFVDAVQVLQTPGGQRHPNGRNLALEHYRGASGEPYVALRADGGDAVFAVGGREAYRLPEGRRLVEAQRPDNTPRQYYVWEPEEFERERAERGLTPDNHPVTTAFGQTCQLEETATMDATPSTDAPASSPLSLADVLNDPERALQLQTTLNNEPSLKDRVRTVAYNGEALPAFVVDAEEPLRITLADGTVVELPPGTVLYGQNGELFAKAPGTTLARQIAELWRAAPAGSALQFGDASPQTEATSHRPAGQAGAEQTGQGPASDEPVATGQEPASDPQAAARGGSLTDQQKAEIANLVKSNSPQGGGGGGGGDSSALRTGLNALGGAVGGVAGMMASTVRGAVKTSQKAAAASRAQVAAPAAPARATQAAAAAHRPEERVRDRAQELVKHCQQMRRDMTTYRKALTDRGIPSVPYDQLSDEHKQTIKTDPELTSLSSAVVAQGKTIETLADPQFLGAAAQVAGDKSLDRQYREPVDAAHKALEQVRRDINGEHRDLPVESEKPRRGKQAGEPTTLSERFKRLSEVIHEIVNKIAQALGLRRSAGPSPG